MIQNNYFERIGFVYGVPKTVVKTVIDKIVIGRVKYPVNPYPEYMVVGVGMGTDQNIAIQYKINDKICSVAYSANDLKLSSSEGDARYMTVESADFVCGKISALVEMRAGIIDISKDECVLKSDEYFNGESVSRDFIMELLDRSSELTVIKPTCNKVTVEEHEYNYLITREVDGSVETYTYERENNFRRVDSDSDKTEFSKEVMSDMFYAMKNYYYGKVTI